ncbi:MAG TPA: pyruvate kinase [Chthoniobacterales bacterium]
MRKTKIICTLGPATEKPETLRQLIAKGADVFRLNMSHASAEWVRALVPQIRHIAREFGRSIGILLDTQGPAIRTGALATPLELHKGDLLEFTMRGTRPTEAKSVAVNYDNFAEDVKRGDAVLVDNGLVKLKVVGKQKNRVLCKVITPATLGSHRHINLPGVHVRLPPMTKKDIVDLALAAELGVEFVGLSFVREASDLDELRRRLARHKSNALVLAKIEDQAAVESIDEIIAAADLIMIARGDLGIEVPMEELPIIQRRIVKTCIRLGKPVVVATHLLESMITNRVPTRAEITDVANAVFEQADAIMLSGETTVGHYPVECVEVLHRVAVRIERSGGAGYARDALLEDERQKTVNSAVVLANSLRGARLIVFTRHGTMARHVSHLRPHHAPVFAFTPSEEVRRQMSILWGVCPICIEFASQPNATIATAEKFLRANRLTNPGDHLVIITDLQAGKHRVDAVQLRTAK